MKKFLFGFLCLAFSVSVTANGNNKSGDIVNLTATTAGIMIKLNSGLPSNCDGTPYGWMLIKKEHTAIISAVLAAWVSDKKAGVVYVSGRENANGYCLVNQFDPVN